MPKGEPREGDRGSATLVVAKADCASEMASAPGEAYPEVFATTRMIGLMEMAAGRVLQPYLAEGELSVGVVVDVKHTAATLPGMRATAHARYLGKKGKLFEFEVWAEDDGGEVGRGTHQRAIIGTQRLLDGANKRAAAKPRS
jgi:predicted thioesterase